jgi:hypothetical protein
MDGFMHWFAGCVFDVPTARLSRLDGESDLAVFLKTIGFLWVE